MKKGLYVAGERQVYANGRSIVQKYRILAHRMVLPSGDDILQLLGSFFSAKTGCWPYIARGKVRCANNTVRKPPNICLGRIHNI